MNYPCQLEKNYDGLFTLFGVLLPYFLLNEIQRKKQNYLMLIDDYYYGIDYLIIHNAIMEDGNDFFFTFRYDEQQKKIFLILNVGDIRKIKMTWIHDYPEQIIPILLIIMKNMFPYLTFTEKNGFCQIWNMTKENVEFIQYLFLIIRNIQNPEFNFNIWVNSQVPQRTQNEFSDGIRKKIIEINKNYCESCGIYVSTQKILEIDHIIEHRYCGINDIENAQGLCHTCHAIKTSWNKRILKN